MQPARALLHTDAPAIRLDGLWQFRLHDRADVVPSAPALDGFSDPDYDDADWHDLPVPSHWQLHGFGRPSYTNIAYPFPIDPPHVPDANPTGDYRRVFDLPQAWPSGRSLLRFDGVDSAFTVWLNGTRLGDAMGSRLPHEFDATEALVPGRNVVAVRVQQWSAGSYLEDQDMWWLSGIFRDVTLQSRPAWAIDDVFVHAGYDHVTGRGTLRVDVEGASALLTVAELGIFDQPTDQEHICDAVRPWSAELPHLYDAELATGGERVRLRIGFRTISTSDGVLRVNGNAITLRGVNRHEFHPDTGRVLDVDTMRADVLAMKQHNINAVRTSHYPPHSAFIDMCDEFGLWVVDECDLETHGFKQIGWRGNPSDDPAWRPAILDRMRRTVERDKNHPSVIMWSLGNEAGTGSNLAASAEWVAARDPSRPRHYEGYWASTYVDVYSRMYPSHAEVARIGARVEDPLDDAVADAHRRSLPFVMCEYAHAMGNGPGGLADYQRIIDAHPRCAGGFVWEWIDHGLRQGDHFAYGGDFGEELHDGNFVCDGLVFPDRTPSPGLLEVQRVFAPVEITATSGHITIANRYDVRDLAHLRFDWALETADGPAATGSLATPPVPARAQVKVPMPDLPVHRDESWLTISAALAEDQPWAPAGHEVAWGQLSLPSGDLPSGDLPRCDRSVPDVVRTTSRTHRSPQGRPMQRLDDGIALGAGVFDGRTGALIRFGGFAVDGPVLDLWRAPTDNDIGAKLDVAWRAVGLHRLHERIVDVSIDTDELIVTSRIGAAATDLGYLYTMRWSSTSDRLDLRVNGDPIGDWPCPLPRLGVRMALPATLGHVGWVGHGPGEAYVDTRNAVRLGRFARDVDEMQTPYVRPQENGNRVDARWLSLVDDAGAGLRIDGDPVFDFTVRRWTSAALDAARHTNDLRATDRIYLNLDVAQHGIGSASCGPGTLPGYALTARPFELRASLRLV